MIEDQFPGIRSRFENLGWTVTEDGCWEWNGSRHKTGYGQISGTGASGPLKAHRVSYELYVGEFDQALYILHKCDNPPCVNPSHLYPGTNQDNMDDANNRGRAKHMYMSGEFAPASKLTWEQVQQIRASTEPGIVLARKYSVSNTSITNIRKGKTWKTPGVKVSVTTR
jgi:hypothetical protein